MSRKVWQKLHTTGSFLFDRISMKRDTGEGRPRSSSHPTWIITIESTVSAQSTVTTSGWKVPSRSLTRQRSIHCRSSPRKGYVSHRSQRSALRPSTMTRKGSLPDEGGPISKSMVLISPCWGASFSRDKACWTACGHFLSEGKKRDGIGRTMSSGKCQGRYRKYAFSCWSETGS